VGSGIGRNPRNLARAIGTLGKVDVPVLGMEVSALSLMFFTAADRRDEGVRALHHEFVETLPEEA